MSFTNPCSWMTVGNLTTLNICALTNSTCMFDPSTRWCCGDFKPIKDGEEPTNVPLYDIKADKDDPVNHLSHYKGSGGIECIEAIRASMTPTEFQGYCKGNTLKYLWRWRDKNGIEDLKKAEVYLGWLIDSASEERKIT